MSERAARVAGSARRLAPAAGYFLFLAVLAEVVFWRSVHIGFFIDDFGYLDIAIRRSWWFAAPVWDFSGQVLRPVTVLAIGLQHELFGYRPTVFHGLAVLLLVSAGVWLALLARRLGVGRFGAGAAAAILVLHATNGYTIMWTASTSSFYSVNLALIVLWLLAVPTPGRRRLALAAALTVVALLSREICLVLPAIATALRYTLGDGAPRPRARRALRESRALWAVLGGYLALRLAFSGWAKRQPVRAQEMPILNWTSFSDALPDSPRHLHDLLIIATSPVRFQLGTTGLSFPTWVLATAALTWVVVLGLVVREHRAGRPVATFGLAWFLLALFPPAFLQAEITYVNYADLAIPGLALAIGAGLDGLVAGGGRRVRLPVAVAGLAALALVAFHGGNTLITPPPELITRPAQIVQQLQLEYPEGPPHGATVVIRDARPEDVLWTSDGDLVRVLFDDPSLEVVFEPAPPG